MQKIVMRVVDGKLDFDIIHASDGSLTRTICEVQTVRHEGLRNVVNRFYFNAVESDRQCANCKAIIKRDNLMGVNLDKLRLGARYVLA